MRTREIVVVGGGIVSLAIALELRQQGAAVTVLCRDFAQAATHAAAGMLAPQAERIPSSPMLDLCLKSRALYPDWTRKLESLSGLNSGYWSCGILSPAYETPHPLPLAPQWLDRAQIHRHQPNLSAEVTGGWWFPEDGQVDNRDLARALWVAVQELGVEVQTGITVEAIVPHHDRVAHLQTSAGDWQANHYIVATGAWSQSLLPIPVWPRKGQILSLQVPRERCDRTGLPLETVLFGSEIYIVPRRDGRIVIGATSEDVGFTPGNTLWGKETLLRAAVRLYPDLQHFPVAEFWWGFRPATADELPILGTSPYQNLTLATGHYRNGILLAPITGALIADFVLHQTADPFLEAFCWSRFKLAGG
ncbi:MAG: glycine oxidase ThiO [Leptolyngbyaceae cyanobacterium CSU_1_3]|nr:glycine oxidase ThiO [Leptolyngbyaceae cyanobacterium CSU_1_3]